MPATLKEASGLLMAGALAGLIAVVPLYAMQQKYWRKSVAKQRVKDRVVFLDLDGVLNQTKRADQIVLEPSLCIKLKAIVEGSDKFGPPAQIVLSTFWKPFIDYVAYVLGRHGIDGSLVVGATPGISKSSTCIQKSCVRHLLHAEALDDERVYPNRASEIREFLRRHPQVKNFVILDDRADAANGADLSPFFLRTDPSIGLTDDHVRRARELLRGASF